MHVILEERTSRFSYKYNIINSTNELIQELRIPLASRQIRSRVKFLMISMIIKYKGVKLLLSIIIQLSSGVSISFVSHTDYAKREHLFNAIISIKATGNCHFL